MPNNENNKYQSNCSINILNEYLSNQIDKDGYYFQLEIRISGVNPNWKTVYIVRKQAEFVSPSILIRKDNKSKIDDKIIYHQNLSEGFATWNEMRIYLSGMRGMLKLI